MLRVLALIGLFLMLNPFALSFQRASRLTTTPPLASVEGRVSVHMTVGRVFGEHAVPNLTLYLFRIEDSKAFQELQRKCRKAVAGGQSNPAAAYDVCMQSIAEAARLVQQMTPTATAQSDREGNYKFESVPAGGRYQVVGVKYEGEEPIVIVGLTSHLKPGENHKVNLSENDAWTDALPPSR